MAVLTCAIVIVAIRAYPLRRRVSKIKRSCLLKTHGTFTRYSNPSWGSYEAQWGARLQHIKEGPHIKIRFHIAYARILTTTMSFRPFVIKPYSMLRVNEREFSSFYDMPSWFTTYCCRDMLQNGSLLIVELDPRQLIRSRHKVESASSY